ncbi:hypothetical protein S7711_04650 [Stachybotrys chartarum IBT 7711]|uniref:Helicase ATP-binding domain-containing protein n=1 Tax=Stachybotrys chartarum (strain CBS 109288 / IBT 7711) TaxID=1280523 RepID=A0A084B5Z8_STACB|nr:hypothetical protein S7711_04650 [Stachybotrys chartarum IBT 7711]
MDSSDHGQRPKRQRLDETWLRQNTSQLGGPSTAQCQNFTPMYHVTSPCAPCTQLAPWLDMMTYHHDSAIAPLTGHLTHSFAPRGSANTFELQSFDRYQTDFSGSILVTQQSVHYPTYQPPHWQPHVGFDMNSMKLENVLAPVSDHFRGTSDGVGVTSNLSASEATQLGQLVCFGMVSALRATYETRIRQVIPTGSLVEMESAERFFLVDYKYIRGRLHTNHGAMMQGLLDDKSLKLFVTFTSNAMEQDMRNSAQSSAVMPCTLDIVVYGPSYVYEEIGSWFEDYEIFLQDPRTCHLDTKYFNPHRLSSLDASQRPPLSEVVLKYSTLIQLSEISQRPDLLSALSITQDLEEAPQPLGVRTALKRHQKQALSFMLSRDNGWGFYQQRPDIWEIVDTTQTRQYLNTVSGVCQLEEPGVFAGGIVADPMGLGKTLTMISLVTMDTERDELFPGSLDAQTGKVQTMATLIIVSPPLLGAWEYELNTHVVPGAMRHRRHHGATRMMGEYELEGIRVVLTTYHTVSAEWMPSNPGESSLLFSVKWNRIILDEVCALDSRARWAVTGTPIQNRLSDFSALLQFIRVHPYDDPRYFDADIVSLWKSGQEVEAIERLKRLSRHIMLRRPKDTIDLPARHDLLCPVDFSQDEKTLYEKIRTLTIRKLDESLYDQSGSYKANSYMNALQQIESLRLFCDLGVQFQAHHEQCETESLDVSLDNWSVTAQRAFSIQQEVHPIVCLQCDSIFDVSRSSLEADDALPQLAHFSDCLRFACANSLISLSSNTMNDASSLLDFGLDYASDTLSSKVQTVIRDIKTRPTDEKWKQRVMELQESKRSLAGVLLSPHEGGQADDNNQGELQVLNSSLSLFT